MFKRLRNISLPILTQITVPYVVLAVLVAAGGTYVINQVVVDSVQERFTNQLIATTTLAAESLVNQEQEMLESLRLISHVQGIGEAILAGSPAALEELATPLAFNAQVDAYAFVSTREVAILTRYLDNTNQRYIRLDTDQRLAETDFVQRVLAGEVDAVGDKFSDLVLTDQGLVYFIAGPVLDGTGSLVGAALIGRFVDGLAITIAQETLSDFSVFSLQGEPMASTLASAAPISTQDVEVVITRQDEGTLQRTWTLAGVTYHELLTPFVVRGDTAIGILGVALPTHLLVQTSQLTRDNTLLLVGAALVLVLAVGAVIARRITRPIQDLRDAALRVSGGDYSVSVGREGTDEVGVLTTTFNEMVGNVKRSKQELLDAYDKTIEGWARALDLRDHETEGHSRRVTDLAVQLGTRLGLSEDQLQQLYRGGLLHDIGKLAVPDSILGKHGPLTEEERTQMELHPQHALLFIESIEFLRMALDVPYAHHERWDGTGYPRGLKGEEIPILARVFAVVDVWDALTTDRPYRVAMGFREALTIIEESKGTHFDPVIVEAFIEMLGDLVNKGMSAADKS
jgi:HAMP domain-containing protein